MSNSPCNLGFVSGIIPPRQASVPLGDESGTITTERTTLQVKLDATPKFFKPIPVPYAIRDAVGAQLVWWSPGEGLAQQLGGPNHRSPQAGWQLSLVWWLQSHYKPSPGSWAVPLLEVRISPNSTWGRPTSSCALTTSPSLSPPSTHTKGYWYTRLLYGITSALRCFRRQWMGTILQGIPQVCCYIDDIFITGKDDAQQLEHLQQVLKHLERFRLRLKQSKCEFMRESVEYIGYNINARVFTHYNPRYKPLRMPHLLRILSSSGPSWA